MSEEQLSWIYQARRVATQANVGGGAIVIDIALATGQLAKIVGMRVNNSGTNDVNINLLDEDNAVAAPLAAVASGASKNAALPSIGTAASAANNLCDCGSVLVAPGQKLTVSQTGAGAQGDTMTIAITLEIFGKGGSGLEPTWSKARSTNEADVTLAASTISAANTWQPARMWS